MTEFQVHWFDSFGNEQVDYLMTRQEAIQRAEQVEGLSTEEVEVWKFVNTREEESETRIWASDL